MKDLTGTRLGQYEIVEGIGHQHGVGNAVDDRLSVLPLSGRHLQLNLKLFRFDRSIGSDPASAGEQVVDRVSGVVEIVRRCVKAWKFASLHRSANLLDEDL